MKILVLYKKKVQPQHNTVIYLFSSILITIKVVAQILEVDRDFWDANSLTKCNQKRGQVNTFWESITPGRNLN